ncbi:hypothetical protein LCGC14_2185630 [marine sediment metagenome]|uniref:Uncharacterized protein n=1 Tax=marine sediment metagenome TaxID=412755 RepID=A0A0F9GGV3_9ZZZZ
MSFMQIEINTKTQALKTLKLSGTCLSGILEDMYEIYTDCVDDKGTYLYVHKKTVYELYSTYLALKAEFIRQWDKKMFEEQHHELVKPI